MVMQNSVLFYFFEAHSAMICTSNDRSTLIKMQKMNSIDRGWVNFKQRNLNYCMLVLHFCSISLKYNSIIKQS